MKFSFTPLTKFGGFAIGQFLRQLTSTLDLAVAYHDRSTDPAADEFRGPMIMLFWHEYIALPFSIRGHCDIAMLLSRHRDAEWLYWAARYMGFEAIRGSTYRGAGTALRQLMEKGKSCNLAFTPDGPRGPRRRMAQGPIYLSSRLQIPLATMGVGYERPWRLNTWDRFALPRPFSRGRIVMGPPVQVPRQLGRNGLEHYRRQTELLLERLTWEAESWATEGGRKINQFPLRPQAKSLRSRRQPMSAGSRESPPDQILPMPGCKPAANGAGILRRCV
jgi:lysophospholipid acyltransferase (LPLAT)-like uncharacterized protein